MPPPRWHLRITDEDAPPRVLPLATGPITLGRSADADLQLDHPTVSRHHARLTPLPGDAWQLADLQSRAGTLLHFHRITAPVTLHPGDTFTISRFQLTLLDTLTPPGSAPHAAAERGLPSEAAGSPAPRSQWSNDAHHDEQSSISVLTRLAPPRLDTAQITALHAFGRSLMQVEDPADRLRQLCAMLCGEQLRARWAMALRLDADDPAHPPRQLAVFPRDATRQGDLHVSRTTIRAMQESQAPVLASNFQASSSGVVEMSILTPPENAPHAAAEGGSFRGATEAAGTPGSAPATAVVACPLTDEPACHELVYVNLPPALGSTEWLALVALAVTQYQQADSAWSARHAIAARAAHQRDLDNARTIQRSILPEAHGLRPWVPHLDLAWRYDPCDAIGGDYVDVIPLPDGRTLLVIADVTGHGLPAALTTLSVHSVLRTALHAGLDLSQAVQTLNQHLCHYLPDGRFVTLVAVALDPATGDLQCVNAGHHAPLILNPTAPPRQLADATDFPLGIDDGTLNIPSPSHAAAEVGSATEAAGTSPRSPTLDPPAPYAAHHDTLHPGDTLVLTTDGVTEMQVNHHWLGTQGLTRELTTLLQKHPATSNPHADAEAGLAAEASGTPHDSPGCEPLAASLHARLLHLRGPTPSLDDLTFLIARRAIQP